MVANEGINLEAKKPGRRQVNNQESRKEGNQERIPAINVFSCFPGFLIRLLAASHRGSVR